MRWVFLGERDYDFLFPMREVFYFFLYYSLFVGFNFSKGSLLEGKDLCNCFREGILEFSISLKIGQVLVGVIFSGSFYPSREPFLREEDYHVIFSLQFHKGGFLFCFLKRREFFGVLFHVTGS